MANPTVTMIAPASWGGPVTGTPSGTVYIPNTYNLVTAQLTDTLALTKLGFVPIMVGEQPVAQLVGANMNVTTDQALTMLVPGNVPFVPRRIVVTNASISLTTAAGGIYDAASKGGNAIVASTQAYSTLTASGIALYLTMGTYRRELGGAALYFALTTAQGAAATADIYVYGDTITR